MAPVVSLASATLLFLSAANAHFTLNTPPSFGFTEDKEAIAPCGGFTPNFDDKSKVSDYHVGGEPIGMKLGHPQANWLFRATLDSPDTKNWTQLFPIVMQSGLGLFCETSVPAPDSWVGKQGILSVVANAPDGILYQCAAVNFVSGTGTPGSTCTNGSVQASFVSDSQLSALVGPSSGGSSPSGSSSSSGSASTPSKTSGGGSSSTSSSSSSPSPTKNAAPSAFGGLLSLGSFAPVVVAGLLGYAML
ncbi:hypothetical protein VTK73DRAFT_919 [Phialemonium thermophilum]|uniref:Copper acquisition factor BIM1-like domain-containing protein n=1 Tax=Phialemonium thermophilum TaxID=223376 RepID=A0ABR3XBY0_9PEZI